MSQTNDLIRHRPRWQPLKAQFKPHFPAARQRQRIVALGVLLLAVAALAASALPMSPSAHASHVSASSAPARRMLISRVDLHVDDLPGDAELEVDLSISQTESDCQTALHGQFCLRYNILRDDMPVESGYGVIPTGDVQVSGSTVTLRIDTRHEPHVIRTSGTGGLISLTWSSASALPRPAARATALTPATVRGSIVNFTIPSTNVTAGILLYGAA